MLSIDARHGDGPTRMSKEAAVMAVEQRGRDEPVNQDVQLAKSQDDTEMKHKPFDIPKRIVFEAWKQVKRAGGGPGADGMTLKDFEDNLSRNLYKIWNRMSSGSYMPPPVKQRKIAKAGGGSRILGIPTVADRVAQATVKLKLEQTCEPHFHRDSYGYRPGISAIEAVRTCRERCWQHDWVVDLDIRACFDNIPHDLLMRAVEKHATTSWEVLYIQRWLKAGVINCEGKKVETREKGTPQGAVISPLLCNLFLHYALDAWMTRELDQIPFERFADDGVYHCKTKRQAEYVLSRIRKRLKSLGLELHPVKTKIVHCNRGQRARGVDNDVPTKFTFLGYDFKPRTFKRRDGSAGLTFSPGVGTEARKSLVSKVKKWKLHRQTDLKLEDLAREMNPGVRGWANYFRHFRPSEMYQTFHHINKRIVEWMRRKYKIRYRKAQRMLERISRQNPTLFHHWQWIKG